MLDSKALWRKNNNIVFLINVSNIEKYKVATICLFIIKQNICSLGLEDTPKRRFSDESYLLIYCFGEFAKHHFNIRILNPNESLSKRIVRVLVFAMPPFA